MFQEEQFLRGSPSARAATEMGQVSETSRTMVRDIQGRQFERRTVVVADASDENPAVRDFYSSLADRFEELLVRETDLGQHAPTDTYLRNAGSDQGASTLIVDPRNLAAVDLYFHEGEPTQMFEWGHQMLQAIALEPLQKLAAGGQFLSAGRLDARTLERFTYMADGRGLRSRQHIYAQMLVDLARRTRADALDIVSLGSGAAVPNIEASRRIESETAKQVRWQLFDLDPAALQHALTLSNSSGLLRSTFDLGPRQEDESSWNFVGRSYIEARHVAEESLDAVDALGLWEYLGPTQARAFLRMMYSKLKPDAPMIVSNMLKSRPHPEYNKRAVGWPKVIMRSEADLLDIVEAADILPEHVVMTHSSDGVYVVMEIWKAE